LGRPPSRAIVPAETEGINTDAAASVLAAGRGALASERAERELAIFQLGQQVGGIMMSRVHRNFSEASEIRLFTQLRESKKYKDLALPRPDGSLRPSETLSEFCQIVFGRSYSTMAEHTQNFQMLGEQAYEIAVRLGLNHAALRAVRALPPDQVSKVQRAIADGAAKAEVMSVIEDLAAKVAQVEEQLQDKDAELQVANTARQKQQTRIDKLEAERRRYNKATPAEQLAEMQRRAVAMMNDVRGGIAGGLRQACAEIGNHGEERGLHDRFLAGLLAEIQHQLDQVRQDFGLADVADPGLPDWLQDDPVAKQLDVQHKAGRGSKA